MSDKNIDFLGIDTEIPGQKFVCLSFLAPSDAAQRKEVFVIKQFLNKYKSEVGDIEDIGENFESWYTLNRNKMDKEFHIQNNFKNSLHGLKIRGSYSTIEEAKHKANTLREGDPSFSVYVGQVGYWMPWCPCDDDVKDQDYMNRELNLMMHKYQENKVKKEIFFNRRVAEQKNRALQENLRRIKKIESEKLKKNSEMSEEKQVNNKDKDLNIQTSQLLQALKKNVFKK